MEVNVHGSMVQIQCEPNEKKESSENKIIQENERVCTLVYSTNLMLMW